MLSNEVVEYCKSIQDSILTSKSKAKIRRYLLEYCKACKDKDCILKSDCIIKKTYCLIFDD